MKKYTAIDLFSGCGGLTLGLKTAGYSVIGAVDINDLAVETYRRNHKGVDVWQTDIRYLSVVKVMRKLKLRKGELDLLAGCPPCQGFSALRTKNGATYNRDRRNNLIKQMLRFVRVLQPKAVMMENVPGLKSRARFVEFRRVLRRLGYQVNWAVKDASEYGVPQRRKRLILVGGHGFKISLFSGFVLRQ